jgi:TonB-dependent receptor
MLNVLWAAPAGAQERSGTITGTVTDVSHAILPGATVKLDPGGASVVSNGQGEFTITGVTPGTYSVTVDYVGFSPSTTSVTVAAGQVARVNPVLNVASASESVIVTAERAHGEAEAINEIRTSDTVLNVLPSDVIRSLPNPNIADALSRLPGVTLERDEGEGKYVQIRGTEPRLSNVTIDSVEIPSPEGLVRQVKLDVIPAGIVDSVQINKTLQADQSADAIGGSVNLVTKSAGEQPTVSIYFGQGYTPIAGGALVEEVEGTIGKRFGVARRFGVLIGGTYDYNGRKTYDLEPLPGGTGTGPTFVPGYDTAELRQYEFTRHRYGFGGSADYKISDSSNVYVRGLYSIFKDFGKRYDYLIATNDDAVPGTNLPSFNTETRLSDFLVSSVSVGGAHVSSQWLVKWQLAASRSRQLAPINGGESITTFNYAGSTSNCQFDPAATKDKYKPQFTAACFTEAYNPANLLLNTITDAKYGLAAQLNLQGAASVARNYHLGSNQSILEAGFNIRNAHKFDNSYEFDYTAIDPTTLPLSNFLIANKTSPNYYFGAYPFGPFGSWDKSLAFLRANPTAFTVVSTQGGNPSNFSLIERVTSGYVMNTINFSRFRLVAGVRLEGTQDRTLSFDTTLAQPCLCFKGNGSYIDILPSASLRMRLDSESDLRFVFGKALARPDPTALTTAVSVDTATNPATYTIGNPALKPEHSYSYDVLYERFLHPLGVIQAGFFYKSLKDPFAQLLTTPTTPPFPGFVLGSNVLQPANAGSGYIYGLELAFQQHFTYLPGFLRGLGVLGNYSYTTSQANNINPGNRTDSPAILRQAPHAWNLSPTYDWGRLSSRVGLEYSSSNIFAYQFVDGADGGIKGPKGDQYLYPHFQVDAQASFRLGKGLTAIVSGKNLNNAVNGLYNGSPQWVLQREFFHTTYLVGLRWNLQREK